MNRYDDCDTVRFIRARLDILATRLDVERATGDLESATDTESEIARLEMQLPLE